MPFKKGQSGNPNGRKAGVPNKVTLEKEAQIAESGLTPLDYMLTLLRDASSTKDDRKWAAANAAPYCHAKLSQIQAKHEGDLNIRQWLMSLGEPD